MAISHSSLWSECVFNLNQNSIIFMWISHPSQTNDNKWWWWLWMDGWVSPRCCYCKNCLGNVYNSKWIFIMFETPAPCLVHSFFSFTGAKWRRLRHFHFNLDSVPGHWHSKDRPICCCFVHGVHALERAPKWSTKSGKHTIVLSVKSIITPLTHCKTLMSEAP